jgi:hypothetical protein
VEHVAEKAKDKAKEGLHATAEKTSHLYEATKIWGSAQVHPGRGFFKGGFRFF